MGRPPHISSGSSTQPSPRRETIMRIATIHTPSGPGPGVLAGKFIVDVHATDPSLPTSVRGLLAGGTATMQGVAHVARREAAVRYLLESVSFLPPVPDPEKIICIGLNYRDHAEESGQAIPRDPVL